MEIVRGGLTARWMEKAHEGGVYEWKGRNSGREAWLSPACAIISGSWIVSSNAK